jgi:hypothetical protein
VEKKPQRLEDNICKSYLGSGANIQNIYGTHTAQQQENNSIKNWQKPDMVAHAYNAST